MVLFNSGGGGDKHISEVQNVAQIDIPTECKNDDCTFKVFLFPWYQKIKTTISNMNICLQMYFRHYIMWDSFQGYLLNSKDVSTWLHKNHELVFR